MKIFLKNARKTANTCWAKRLMVGKRLDSTINVLFECVLPRYICYICYFSKLKKNFCLLQHCLLPTILKSTDEHLRSFIASPVAW